jgi:hypothetical protein
MKRMKLSELPESVRRQVEATEHNIEDLLLCLNGMRPDDVPSMHWSWDEREWQPALVDEDEYYPQCYEVLGDSIGPGSVQEKPLDYQILWSVPVCGRDGEKHWHDIQRFREGSVRQAIVFDYDVAAPKSADEACGEQRLTVWFGTTERLPLIKVCASDDNRIPVDLDLLISMATQLDDLRAYLKIERQAQEILQVRAQRTEEMDLHTNE